MISAYTIVGVFGIDATPICSHSVWPFAPWPGPPTPIQPATCPATTFEAAVGVIVARMPCATFVAWCPA